MNGLSPKEIVALITKLQNDLDELDQNIPAGSPKKKLIEDAINSLDVVLQDIVAQGLKDNTEKLAKLKDKLTQATEDLKKLKANLESIVAAFNTAAAIVNTATSLLGVL